MSSDSQYKRLRQIVTELRAIAIVDEFPEDQVRQAGKLLRESVSLGAFAKDEYAGLRNLVNRPKSPALFEPLKRLSKRWWVNDPDIFCWDDAVHILLPELGKQLDREGAPLFELWFKACKPIAKLMEESFPTIKPEQGEGNGGPGSTPKKLTVDPKADRAAILADMQPADRKAYLAYQYAETMAERRLQDRDAYDWLLENGINTDQGDVGELADYELPTFDTWVKQLRNARKPLHEQKYTRRTGRATSKSIVKQDEV